MFCEIWHINYRRVEKLGIATGRKAGTLVLPEYCNRMWSRKQVELIYDFTDTPLPRKANHKSGSIAESYDAQYKTRIWDVLQDIDCVIVLSLASPSACVRLAPCISRGEAVPSHS
jgi:hypothetical protein